MNWNFIKHLLDQPDHVLTKNGIELKRLAERMKVDDYILNEDDKMIIDQKWRQIWKDKT